MHIEQWDDGLKEHESRQVWGLLCAADHEFVPALSARSSSTQTDFAGRSAEEAEPVTYFREVSSQRFLLAREETGEISGFLSYRLDAAPWQDTQHHDADVGPTAYVTTVIVDPEHRRRGITTALYVEIFRLADALHRTVSTRTWSLNDGHLRILERFGFREILRLPDDRQQGVDTVYLERPCGGAEPTGAER